MLQTGFVLAPPACVLPRGTGCCICTECKTSPGHMAQKPVNKLVADVGAGAAWKFEDTHQLQEGGGGVRGPPWNCSDCTSPGITGELRSGTLSSRHQ